VIGTETVKGVEFVVLEHADRVAARIRHEPGSAPAPGNVQVPTVVAGDRNPSTAPIAFGEQTSTTRPGRASWQ
jgi:hypothetical protein